MEWNSFHVTSAPGSTSEPASVRKPGRNQRGQTVMEALLLTGVLFFITMFVSNLFRERMRDALLVPIHERTSNVVRFGNGQREAIQATKPEEDEQNPFNSTRNRPLHL